jgi:dihydrodipicolinate reductase
MTDHIAALRRNKIVPVSGTTGAKTQQFRAWFLRVSMLLSEWRDCPENWARP